ncbi:hypothetical protein EC950943_4117B, partial [Escherichia coli 95.0943]
INNNNDIYFMSGSTSQLQRQFFLLMFPPMKPRHYN